MAVSRPCPVDMIPQASVSVPSGSTVMRDMSLPRPAERPARHLDRVGEAEAAQRAAGLGGVRAAGRETGAVDEVRRHRHVAGEIAAIVVEDERRAERHRLGRDQVAHAQLERVEPELARGDVDRALERIGRLRPPGAAIGVPSAPCW